MEELQQLIELIQKLPNTALWVLAGYLAFKLATIGSIYGIIRLIVVKVHDYYTRPKQYHFHGKPIDAATAHELDVQLFRLRAGFSHLHNFGVHQLKQALDQMEAEKAKGK